MKIGLYEKPTKTKGELSGEEMRITFSMESQSSIMCGIIILKFLIQNPDLFRDETGFVQRMLNTLVDYYNQLNSIN